MASRYFEGGGRVTVTIDLFAGCGGWSEGAKLLLPSFASSIVGVEVMPEALATHRAAGHPAVEMSAAARIPSWLKFVFGLIASPPCQAFSSAGKKLGKHDLPIIAEAIEWIIENALTTDMHEPLPERFAEACQDPRSILVVEPLRWALALRPEWICLEQVPAVLPLWEEFAEILDMVGYSTWTGKLSSEEYGVPQTRTRAILIASRTRKVGRPPETHQAYDRRKKCPRKGTEHRRPYVTMARALGWGMSRRPSMTLTGGGTGSGGGVEAFGNGARQSMDAEAEAGQWEHPVVNTRGERKTPGGNEFSSDTPSWALTSKARSWHVVGNNSVGGGPLAERHDDEPAMTVGSRADLWKMRSSAQSNATERDIDQPAPTITAGHDRAERVWLRTSVSDAGYDKPIPRAADEAPAATVDSKMRSAEWQEEPTGYDRRQVGGDGTPVGILPTSVPAPTIASAGLSTGRDQWVYDRPSTTVAGDPRVSEPGYRGGPKSYDEAGNYIDKRSMTNAKRVTLEQALILQSFPEDYPVQGSRSKGFLQVGNAVPPLMGAHVLAEATGMIAP